MRTIITLSLTTAEADSLLFLANLGSADMQAYNEHEIKHYGLTKPKLDAMTRAHTKLRTYVQLRRAREQARKQAKP